MDSRDQPMGVSYPRLSNKDDGPPSSFGDFVVFLIGAMVHDPALAIEASGLLMAMTDMLDELDADPSKGLLGYTHHGEPGNGVLIQYWRSFEALEEYSHDSRAQHSARLACVEPARGG